MFSGASLNTPTSALKLAVKPLIAIFVVCLSQTLFADTTVVKSALSHTVGGFELSIDNEAATCQLQTKAASSDTRKTIPLLLGAPCYWIVSNETKQLLEYDYKAVDAENTLLIAGTPLDWPDEKKAYQKLPDNSYCTQHLQGIVISKKEIFAVDEKMLGAHCETGMAIDEKIFYAMAHNPARYQEKVIGKAVEVKSPVEIQKAAEEEKSLFDSVTDSIKSFFSGKTEDAK
jgi:hypothetical protein